MKNSNIGTAVLRVVPALCLLLTVVSVAIPRHINWHPGRRYTTSASQCAAKTVKSISQVKMTCTALTGS